MALKGAAVTIRYVIPMDFAIIFASLLMPLRQIVPKTNFASPMEYVEPHAHHPTAHREIALMVFYANRMVYAILVTIILLTCKSFKLI